MGHFAGGKLSDFHRRFPQLSAVVLLEDLLVPETHQVHHGDGGAGVTKGSPLLAQAGPHSVSSGAEAVQLRGGLQVPLLMDVHQDYPICPAVALHDSTDAGRPRFQLLWKVLAERVLKAESKQASVWREAGEVLHDVQHALRVFLHHHGEISHVEKALAFGRDLLLDKVDPLLDKLAHVLLGPLGAPLAGAVCEILLKEVVDKPKLLVLLEPDRDLFRLVHSVYDSLLRDFGEGVEVGEVLIGRLEMSNKVVIDTGHICEGCHDDVLDPTLLDLLVDGDLVLQGVTTELSDCALTNGVVQAEEVHCPQSLSFLHTNILDVLLDLGDFLCNVGHFFVADLELFATEW